MKSSIHISAFAIIIFLGLAPSIAVSKPLLLDKRTGGEVQWIFAPRTDVSCSYRTLQAYQKGERVVFLNCVDGKCRWINGNTFTFILWPGKTTARNLEVKPKDARLHYMCRGRRGEPTCGCTQWTPQDESDL